LPKSESGYWWRVLLALRKIVPKETPPVLLGNRSASHAPVLGTPRFEGDLTLLQTYGDGYWLYRLIFGAQAAFALGPPSIHTFTPDNYKLSGSADLVFRRLNDGTPHEIFAYTGVKATKLVVKGEPNKAVEEVWSVLANGRTDASAVSTDAVLSAIAAIDAARVIFTASELNVRLGDNADALTSADDLNVLGYQITIDNHAANDVGSDGLVEPEADGFYDVMLELKLARLPVTTYRTWVDSDTAVQCRIKHTLDSNRDHEWRLPLLSLQDDFGEEVKGPELIRPTLKFVGRRAAGTNPTWVSLNEAIQLVATSNHVTTQQS